MWMLSAPRLDAEETFLACVEGVEDETVAANMISCAGEVSDCSEEFETSAGAGKLHLLLEADFGLSRVSTAEMSSLYREEFADRRGENHEDYDKIRVRADLCLACGHREVGTLDHHVPKSLFPALAVAPLNLTPMCFVCNRAKSTAVARTDGTRFIHPYFDTFDDSVWLGATIETLPMPHVSFGLTPGPRAQVDTERILAHIARYELNELYGSQAARIARQFRGAFEGKWRAGGSDSVREFAEEIAEAHSLDRLNSCETATWQAFAASPWFCDRGFLEFGR